MLSAHAIHIQLVTKLYTYGFSCCRLHVQLHCHSEHICVQVGQAMLASLNKSHFNTAWRPCEVRWLFFRTISAMNLRRDFYSQIPMLFSPFGCTTNPPPPAPPFLLTLNQSPKEIAGSDITNCLTNTMYVHLKLHDEPCRHWRFELILSHA